MLADGIEPNGIMITGALRADAGLRPGGVFSVHVQGAPGNTFVQLGAVRIPLADYPQMTPGIMVRAEVLGTGDALEIRISPQVQSPQQSPGIPSAAPPAQGLVAEVLAAMNALNAAEFAPRLIPAHLPQSAEALRHLFSLFLSRDAVGNSLDRLSVLLSQAATAGAIPRDMAGYFAALAVQVRTTEAEGFQKLLERLAGERGVEARISAILKGAPDRDKALAALGQTLMNQVARLRGMQPLQAWLRSTGRMREFDQGVERVMERLSGAALQQVHGVDQPYVFIDAPLAPASGFQRAQIHIFGEGGGKGRAFDTHNTAIVLDLAMSRLGDLWVAVQFRDDHCRCEVRAAAEAVALIDAHRDELKEALVRAGFASAQVSAAPWDGDRIRETAALLRRFAGIDVNA